MTNISKIKLAIAPLTWSNDDLPELGGENTFEQCISEMALAGYSGCEIGCKFPRDVVKLKTALELRNLSVCNQWFSFKFTTEPFEKVKSDFIEHIKFLKAFGASVVNGAEVGNSIQGEMKVGLSNKPSFSDEEWTRIGGYFSELGKVAQDLGFSLCYHHHMGTVVQTEAEVDRFFEVTDERYVFFNYDSGHFYFSKEDPVALLKKYLPRTRHIHLKDVRKDVLNQSLANDSSFLQAVLNGIFAIPGDGVIDFSSIFKLIKENYNGWLVVEAEQDPAKANPLEHAIRSRQFIKSHLGI